MGKKIILLSTEHAFQEQDSSQKGELWNILLYLVETYAPTLIIEEWKAGDSLTLARRIAKEKLLGAWHNMSPPFSEGLTWPKDPDIDGPGFRNLGRLMLREYGPIHLQTARESYMIQRIQHEAGQSQTILVILGLAHHQSMAEKLVAAGYEVEAFTYIRPSDPALPDSNWKWREPGEFEPSES